MRVKKFCRKPFEWLEVQNGKAYFCCPGWVKMEGVDIEGKSVSEMWNSPIAQKFRASILDGSFRYCLADNCFYLSRGEEIPLWWERDGFPLKDIGAVSDVRLREIIDKKMTVLNDGPFSFTAGYDVTCNLSCPSCRNKKMFSQKDSIERGIAFQNRVFSEIGKNLRFLYLSGVGDPFASAVYWKLLRELSHEKYPNLEIHLGTNGLLWTPENWEAMKGINNQIRSAEISIDATCSETYAKNRPGGNWRSLMANLDFISELRRNGPLRLVLISFVVQHNNYREMPAFIELAEKLGFDLVHFHKLRNWGSFSMPEYRSRAIHSICHPEYHIFLETLSQKCFEHPRVVLTCLYKWRQKALKIKKLGNIGFQMLGILNLPLRALNKAYLSIYCIAQAIYRKMKKLRILKQSLKLLLRSNFHYYRIGMAKSPFWIGIPGKGRKVYADINHHKNNRFIYEEVVLYDVYGLFNYRAKNNNPTLIVDIGAHVGMFSVLCTVLFPRAEIEAYEPNELSLSFLKKNSKKTNIHVFPYAVLDRYGEEMLNVSGKMGNASISSKGTAAVKCIPASEVAKGRIIDLLKMDCEGSEWTILQDTEFLKRIKNLRIEYHLGSNQTVQELRQLIEKAGHRIIRMSSPSRLCNNFEFIGVIWSENLLI